MPEMNLSVPRSAQVPTAFVHLLQDYLTTQSAHLSAIVGKSPPRNNAALEPYSAIEFVDMLNVASKQLNDPLLGLHLGASFEVSRLGTLGYVFASSDCLGDAIMRARKFYKLVQDTNEMKFIANGQTVVIEWPVKKAHFGRVFDEMGMAILLQGLRELTQQPIVVPLVEFDNPPPRDITAFTDYFGGEVRFEQSCSRFHLPVNLLGLPFMRSDPVLCRLLEEQANQSLTARNSVGEVERSVLRAMARQVGLSFPSLETVAEELKLSSNQLRHILNKNNLNFRDLHQGLLYRLAQEYLADRRITILDIATRLGYSEQSAFARAFVRWSGQTPQGFRKALN